MDTALTISLGVLLLGLAAVVVRHRIRRRRLWYTGEGWSEHARLVEDRALVLAALREADTALAAGRIGAESHHAERERLMAEAAELTRKMDELRERLAAERANLERLAELRRAAP